MRDQRGQGMVEYALIIGLVAIALVVAITTMGGEIKETFLNISETLKGARG